MTFRVYFVQAESGLIKIGYCRNLRYRMYGLRFQTGAPVKLLAALEGWTQSDRARAVEKHLHSKFAAHRAHHEWFQPAPEILRFIQEPILETQ